MSENLSVDGVDVIVGGNRRHAFDIAKDFVREQSEGEWDEATIRRDAMKLSSLMLAFAKAAALPDPVEG